MKTPKITIAALGALALAAPAVAQDTEPTSSVPTAQEQCAQLRTDMGKDAFKLAFGTNENRSNAFGKCVSKRNAATDEARAEAKSNAAKDCKSEQAADEAAFAAKYGTGKTKRNAYGKCVSTKAKAKTADAVEEQVEATVEAATTCKAERRADADAFRAKYGTNANKRNAFGKCVSAQAKAQQDDQAEEPTEAPAAA